MWLWPDSTHFMTHWYQFRFVLCILLVCRLSWISLLVWFYLPYHRPSMNCIPLSSSTGLDLSTSSPVLHTRCRNPIIQTVTTTRTVIDQVCSLWLCQHQSNNWTLQHLNLVYDTHTHARTHARTCIGWRSRVNLDSWFREIWFLSLTNMKISIFKLSPGTLLSLLYIYLYFI